MLFGLWAAAAGCTATSATVLPQPFTVGLDGGVLVGQGAFDDQAPFPMVLDTGSPITVYDDHSGKLSAHTGKLRVFGYDPAGAPVPRLELDDVRVFATPLGPLGPGAGIAVGGLLGGDNLQRWAVGLDYRGAPAVTLSPVITPCDCALGGQCEGVFRFALAGGGADRPISVGPDVFTYPATRVLIDVCLEPLADPVVRDLPCATDNPDTGLLSPAYAPSGVEVKLMLSTGFPGLAIGSGAFDRLRGAGQAAQALGGGVTLHLPDVSGGAITVGSASLGGAGVSALALVSREGYFGPCGDLARSRRQRRSPPDLPRQGERACLLRASNLCPGIGSPPDACDDSNDASGAAAVIELGGPLDAWVVDDGSSLLTGINADVRPQTATVEGIIGTEVLARLVSTIDYPAHRLIAHCADPTTGDPFVTPDGAVVTIPRCLTYPRETQAPAGCDDDSLCRPQSDTSCNPRALTP